MKAFFWATFIALGNYCFGLCALTHFLNKKSTKKQKRISFYTLLIGFLGGTIGFVILPKHSIYSNSIFVFEIMIFGYNLWYLFGSGFFRPIYYKALIEYFTDLFVDDESDEFINTEAVPTELISFTEIDKMQGVEFELFCAELLKKNGFSNVRLTPRTGDQGADLLATHGHIEYAIQCKRFYSQLSNKPIQEVNAAKAYYNCDKAAVMTNSYFTQGAKDIALRTNTMLWDRSVLRQFISGTFQQW